MDMPIFAFEILSLYTAFWICFWVGLFFAIMSGLMSGIFGGSHADASHLGGHGLDVGGHDVGGHDGHPGGGAEGHDMGQGVGHSMPDFPALSPVTISTFVTVFGGAGVIFTKIPETSPVYFSVPLAMVCAFGTSYGVFLIFSKIFHAVQGSSEVLQGSLVGQSATVTISIPTDGMGEIVYVAGAGRQNAQARASDGQPISTGAEVTIMKVVGGNFYVKRKTE